MAEELYVLAGDLRFIPVADVHGQTKQKFDYENNDVILTHAYTRTRSKILSEDLANLFKQFETPKSWAQAIINFSLLCKLDPDEVAEGVYSTLKEMKHEGFLVAYKEGVDNKIIQTLKPGDDFKTYVVKEILQLLNDTELYRLEDDKGISYALKLYKKGEFKISSTKKNEANILQKLDGKINPLFIEEGKHNNADYLIMEWCHGTNCITAAHQYRNYNIQQNALKMLDLCIAILNAYEHLHKQGILHADVHPGNILVTGNGKVKIIDFGISVNQENALNQKRGGIDFYYEPEYAAALLKKNYFMPVTIQAEIYSVAALLHHLISGHHYINFSFEKDKLYHQIVNDAPNSFQSYDLNLPVSLDVVFLKALSKESKERFSSFYDFADALIKVLESISADSRYFIADKEDAEKKFIEYLIKKFDFNSTLIKKGLSFSPTSSVNFGAAGIAYMYFRMACVREDAALLELADVWANRAGNYTAGFDKAFNSTLIDINEASVGRRSIYHSPTGVHLVQALISYCRGDSLAWHDAIQKFITAGKIQCDKTDLTLGKAGLLIGAALLYKELQPGDYFKLKQVSSFANAIMQELCMQLNDYAPVHKPGNIKYFGMAHGWAGFLYAILFWCNESSQSLPEGFEKRVEDLIGIGIETSEAIRWPVSFVNKSSWPGWCHGNAGYVFLLLLLHKHFKEEKYLSLAEKAATVILNDVKNTNANLCCGMSGQAYALIKLYNSTGEKKYIYEIEKIKRRILNNISSSALMNNSLYKGEVGAGVLLCELEKISAARMPLFE